jgi:hypothetical protein
MISIIRDDKTVKILLEHGPIESTYHFNFDCGDKHYASLLKNHFDKALRARIENIRQEEYEKGYKDGRAKRAKKSWFSTLLRLGQ